MSITLVDSPETENSPAWGFVDTLAVEDRGAPEMDSVVLETAVPVGLASPLHEDVRPKRRPSRLIARWVPDPRGEQGLICIWVPWTAGEASGPNRDRYSETGF